MVVEWYDFGPDAPYESANMLRFDRQGRAAFARVLGVAATDDGQGLMMAIQERFDSYFQVKEFASANAIPFEAEVEFDP